MIRVLDLEKFAFEQIWRPYWWTFSGDPDRLRKMPFTLDETAGNLRVQSEWRDLVAVRLLRIGYSIPEWVQHPLADVLREFKIDPHMEALVEADRKRDAS